MGHIKEPKGIDFIIKSDPLTDKAREEISEFIQNYKKSKTNKNVKTRNFTKQRKAVQA